MKSLAFDLRRSPWRTRVIFAIMASALALCLESPADGQTYWTGSVSTDWGNALNWNPNQVPSGLAIIDTNSGNEPVVSANASPGSIYVGWSAASGANTSLTVDNGATLSANHIYLGNNPNSTGALIVNGATVDAYAITLGNANGNGSLTLVNATASLVYSLGVGYTGPTTDSATMSGSSNVTMSGSLEIGIGSSAVGSLTVTGGSITSNGLSVGSTGTGTFSLSGASSSASSTGSVSVGTASSPGTAGGNGTIGLTNGATLSSTGSNFTIGDASGGSAGTGLVTVSGSGSKLTSDGVLTVGNAGAGSLQISAGGEVDSVGGWDTNETVVGGSTGGTGTVTVDGSGSLLKITGESGLAVGHTGTGSVTITNGAAVTVAAGSPTTLGYGAGSSGSISVTGTGSSFSSGGTLYIGYGNGSGTLTIGTGASASVAYGYSAQILPTGTLTLSGGTFTGNILLNGGLLTGYGKVTGSITAAPVPSSLTLILGSPLEVSGSLTATNIALTVNNSNGKTFYSGEPFSLLENGTSGPLSIGGTFSSVDLPSLPSGLEWDTQDLYSDGTVSIESAVPEPTSYALVMGSVGLFIALWRKRRPISVS